MDGNAIDSNVIIRFINGDETIRDFLKKLEDIQIPSVVLGELLFGADKTAEIYGKIKSELQRNGRILPENDMWIAATAIENNLTLCSQDKHFLEISNLSLKRI